MPSPARLIARPVFASVERRLSRMRELLAAGERGLESGPVAGRDPDEDDLAARSGDLDRCVDGRLLAGGLEHDVQPASPGLTEDDGSLVTVRCRGHDGVRTQTDGGIPAVRQRVGRDDACHTGGPRDRHDEQADRTAADDADGRPGHVPGPLDGVDGDGQRLDQRGGDVVDAVGHGVERRFRPRHVLPQGTVGRGQTGEPHRDAQVHGAGPARLAPAARHAWVNGDATATLRSTLHDARELMARDDGSIDAIVPDPAVDQPVTVRPAQAHGGHTDQDLAGDRVGSRLLAKDEPATGLETQDKHGSGGPIGRGACRVAAAACCIRPVAAAADCP